MAIPQKCTVLVVGGGPAGSYPAAALAREGIDVVLLEADKFPRYHIGESTLPSLRQFFRFIDFYDTFNAHGFYQKNGAAFRLNQSKPDASTDFLAAGGPNGYAWNLIRSESDELLLRHASATGAKVFELTKVDAIQFASQAGSKAESNGLAIGPNDRPVSATWSCKDGSSGQISFDYLIDASGRHGILSTKYLKNRKYNDSFKNIANWGYWKDCDMYDVGGPTEGYPYFEALQDASGWCWFMPLHDGTCSVGVVQNQKMAMEKKREQKLDSSSKFYHHSVNLAARTKELLSKASLTSEIRSASDWSYTASTYHMPYARITGDAGCFIDPFFSSGVHLAVTSGLSAAITIAASIRGDFDESRLGSWHSNKTVESYTRFYLAVSSAMKQIRGQEVPVILDVDNEGFQQAFNVLRPIIQGDVDTDSTGKMSQMELSKAIEFCFKAFTYVAPEQKDALFEKLKSLGVDSTASDAELQSIQQSLTDEEKQIVEVLRSRRMIRDDPFEMESFTLDSIDGLSPRLERGRLGLVDAESVKVDKAKLYSTQFLDGKVQGIRPRMEGVEQNA